MLIDTPANKNIICSDPSKVGFKHEYIVCKGGRILHSLTTIFIMKSVH